MREMHELPTITSGAGVTTRAILGPVFVRFFRAGLSLCMYPVFAYSLGLNPKLFLLPLLKWREITNMSCF